MNHKKYAEAVVSSLQEMDGVSKILLFGSVSRDEHSPGSDIDIAVVLDDSMQKIPLSLDGFPLNFRVDAHRRVSQIPNPGSIGTDLLLCYERQYKNCLRLRGHRNRVDMLHEVGSVVYDCYKK